MKTTLKIETTDSTQNLQTQICIDNSCPFKDFIINQSELNGQNDTMSIQIDDSGIIFRFQKNRFILNDINKQLLKEFINQF